MTVYWTANAKRHLAAIYHYIAQDSKVYARRMVDRITGRSRQIGTRPLAGQIVPEFGCDDIREVLSKSYRIIDRVRTERIEVLAVVHGTQDLPDLIGSQES